MESGETGLREDGNSPHAVKDDLGVAGPEVTTGESMPHLMDEDGEKACHHKDENANNVGSIIEIAPHGAHESKDQPVPWLYPDWNAE